MIVDLDARMRQGSKPLIDLLQFAHLSAQSDHYKEQTPTGAVGDKPEMGWNVAENVKL